MGLLSKIFSRKNKTATTEPANGHAAAPVSPPATTAKPAPKNGAKQTPAKKATKATKTAPKATKTAAKTTKAAAKKTPAKKAVKKA